MKKIVTLLAVIVLVSCGKADYDPQEVVPGLGTKSSSEITLAMNDFSFDLLHQCYQSGRDLALSPMSLSMALSMAADGAQGKTLSEMMKVLGFSGFKQKDLDEYNRQLLLHLKNVDPEVTFASANSMWLQEGFTPKAAYVEQVVNYYSSVVKSINFYDKENALKEINGWCSERTDGMVPQFLKDNKNQAPVMMLLNALFLEAKWAKIEGCPPPSLHYLKFKEESGKSSYVNSLFNYMPVLYSEDKEAQMIRLFLGDGAYALTLLLPKEDVKLNDFQKSLNAKKWMNYVSGLKETLGKIAFPMMEIDFDASMRDFLKYMGMKEALSPLADFTLISDAGLFIEEVRQSVKVTVNTEGVKAAAISSVYFGETGMPKEIDCLFAADHPFIFAIEETKSGAILFIGNKSAI